MNWIKRLFQKCTESCAIHFVMPMCFDMLPEYGKPIYGYCAKGFDVRPVTTKELREQIMTRANKDFIAFLH
jgi:Fe-S-cluster containining protein